MEAGTTLPEEVQVVSESGKKLICAFFSGDGEHKVTIDKKTVVWTHQGSRSTTRGAQSGDRLSRSRQFDGREIEIIDGLPDRSSRTSIEKRERERGKE
jgi:hypothetical protein